jgi:methylenetetrahydrofolate dehydrogenase (NADP+)/methenyltetrahydrofolate cyclohydrolase
MTTIFDGRAFAAEKEISLGLRVLGLKTRGVNPKLASILIGDNPASRLYVGLKKKAAEKIGAEVDIYFLPTNTKLDEILLLIDTLNTDQTVNGIMIQLPLPEPISQYKKEILEAIDPKKDVDGLRPDSQFLHPTSKAVVDILKVAEKSLKVNPKSVCVVGATGMVGTPLVKELKAEGYEVSEANEKTDNLAEKTSNAEVVISATGVPSLIRPEMIQKEAIVIDVGSPKGDFEPTVSTKAGFFTPVPGGVGPVTIFCLLENLISAC